MAVEPLPRPNTLLATLRKVINSSTSSKGTDNLLSSSGEVLPKDNTAHLHLGNTVVPLSSTVVPLQASTEPLKVTMGAAHQHPKAHRLHTELHLPCRPAGSLSGIRAGSGGTMSSRLRAARSGTLRLTCPRDLMLLLPLVRLTTLRLVTTSEVSSATRTGTAGMTTTQLPVRLL
jgi:hypothetical protein